MSDLQGINVYHKQLSTEQIEKGLHRDFVGGLWEQIGHLQHDFLISAGMRPEHLLLDVGCGCLRGGVHFIPYLETGHYHGVDLNASLIEAGKREVEAAGLVDKAPCLLIDENFTFQRFGKQFDYLISVSLFTHLPFNNIVKCLRRAREVLKPEGVYFATYFEAPEPAWLEPVTQEPGNVITYYDSDPFHYSVDELGFMAEIAGLKVEIIGDWGHPRNQKMAKFMLGA